MPRRDPGVSGAAVLGIRPHTAAPGALQPLSAAGQDPGQLAAASAIGLRACLAAVNAGAVEALAVPYDGLVPG